MWRIYDDLQLITIDLQKIKVDVEEIKITQNQTQLTQNENAKDKGIQEDFIIKYNLKVPFSLLAEFKEFNENLSQDEVFRKDFVCIYKNKYQ